MNNERKLNEEELQELRARAKEVLANLEVDDLSTELEKKLHSSWLNGEVPNLGISERCRFFDRNGFLYLPKFASVEEVQAMKIQMEDLTNDWDPAEKTVVFSTRVEDNEAQGSNDYFLESSSRVHYFAEPTALTESGSLQPEFLNNKIRALNKSGHAMHIIPGAFQDYTQSDKVKALVAELGWKDPVVPQSMYICKNPKIGGTVHSHQDSTFLYTEPRQSCLGLWLALDDATLLNGCLWVRPKSHRESVRRQFKRNAVHFTQDMIDQGSNVGKGDLSQPKMVFEIFSHDIAWEGKLPDNSEPPCQGLLEAGFIPIECQPGDLLAFPGELDHLSLQNYSNEQRHTFQLHLVEGPGAGVNWSKNNWLQYPKNTAFMNIKQTEK